MDEQLTSEKGTKVDYQAGWSRGRRGALVVLAALVFMGCGGDDADESGADQFAAAESSPENAAGQDARQLEDLLIEQQLEVARGEVERLDADAQALRNVANRKAAEVEALERAVAGATGEAATDLETELNAARQEAEELERMATEAEEEVAKAKNEENNLEQRKKDKDGCETKPSTSTTALTFNTCNELATGAIPAGALGSIPSMCGGGGIGGGSGPAGAEGSFAISPLAGLDGHVMTCGGSGNPTGRELIRLAERVSGAFFEQIESETGDQVLVLVLPVEYTSEVFEIAAEEQVSIVPTEVNTAVDESALIAEILKDQPESAAGLLNQEGFTSLDQATIAELPLETKMAFKPSLVTQLDLKDFGEPVGAELAANFEDVSIGALHALDFEIVDMVLQADPTIQGVLSTGQLESAGVAVPAGAQGSDTTIADDTSDTTVADDASDTGDASETTVADDGGSGETTGSTSDSGTTVTTDPSSDETQTTSASSSTATTTTVVPSSTTTAPTSTTTTEAVDE